MLRNLRKDRVFGADTGMRKSTRRALAILLAAPGTLAATPSAFASPPVPDTVEFEHAAPRETVAAAALGRNTLRGTVRTGRHFNVVGLRWQGDAASSLAVRARTRRGWGRWTAVPVDPDHGPDVGAPEHLAPGRGSDPVWAGEANALQYSLRTDGRIRDVRLEFINTQGTATAADRQHRAKAAVARPVAPAPGVPPIITRDEWGASRCPPRATPGYGEVKLAFVHHTVTANDYAPTDSAALVRGICIYHRNSNGWNDIGYNLLVDKYGQVFEGRAGGVDAAVVGAQAQGYNAQSTGIANLGDFSTTGQTPAGLDALARILRWKLALQGIPSTGTVQVTSTGGSLNRYPAGARVTFDRISGHRDGDATACPGDALYAQLPQIRQMAASAGPVPALASLTLTARSPGITFGSKAVLTARLAAPGGVPLPAALMEAQLLGRFGAWKTLHTLVTDSSGSATTEVRLAYTHALRARFAGGPGISAAQSKPLVIGVRPSIAARLVPGPANLLRRGARVAVEGTVKPAKRSGLMLVDQLVPGGKKRVGRRVVRVRSGRGRSSFLFTRAGEYVIRFAVAQDGRNLGARSKAIRIRVR
jgi:hypothetical protein